MCCLEITILTIEKCELCTCEINSKTPRENKAGPMGLKKDVRWGFKNGTLKPDTIPLGKTHQSYSVLLITYPQSLGSDLLQNPQINICPLMATSRNNVWLPVANQGHKRNSKSPPKLLHFKVCVGLESIPHRHGHFPSAPWVYKCQPFHLWPLAKGVTL